jgi:hypothetical protein
MHTASPACAGKFYTEKEMPVYCKIISGQATKGGPQYFLAVPTKTLQIFIGKAVLLSEHYY